MRIAIIIDSLGRGGAERQVLYAASELARRGCTTELIHYYPLSSESYESERAAPARLTCVPKGRRPVRFLLRLREQLRRGRFDVVHSYKGSVCLYGGLAARLAGVPVIVGGYRGGRYVEPAPIRLGHVLLNRVQSAWVVNSPTVVDELVRRIHADRSRCFVVRNGIDVSAFRSALAKPEAKARLGFDPRCDVVSIIAGLRPEKDHEMFLRAAARVARSDPGVHFLLVGDGPQRSAIEGRIAALGLGERIFLLGMRSDVAALLAATDLSVLTSEWEGLSNSLMESMCAGVPVITTDYPGASELVTDGHDGAVVPRGDAAALAERIARLLRDPAERERLGRNARYTIETRYSVEHMASALLEVYERLLHEAGEGRERRPDRS